jgi:hypothetical protein
MDLKKKIFYRARQNLRTVHCPGDKYFNFIRNRYSYDNRQTGQSAGATLSLTRRQSCSAEYTHLDIEHSSPSLCLSKGFHAEHFQVFCLQCFLKFLLIGRINALDYKFCGVVIANYYFFGRA